MYLELEDILEVCKSAYDSLTAEDKNESLLADILGAMGLHWGHRGFFILSELNIRKANRIRSSQENKDYFAISWSEVNLSNVTASAGRFDEALALQLKAEESRKRAWTEASQISKDEGVIYQNLGRCYSLVERFDEARVHLDEAVSIFERSENWAMLAL